MTEPTAKQIEAWEALHSEGSINAAATKLGLTWAAVAKRVELYVRATGETMPPSRQRVRVLGLNARVDELHSRIAKLEARITALEHRPATRVEWHPSHRRIKDGGRQVRQQRREAGVPRRSRG